MNIFVRDQLALVASPKAFLYDRPEEDAGPQSDEVLSGWALRITEEERDGWAGVFTHYGYRGWIRTGHLIPADGEQLKERSRQGLLRVSAPWMDIYSAPDVKGRLLTCLPRGSFVLPAPAELREGWQKILACDGTEGWVHRMDLMPREDSDDALIPETAGPECFLRMAREAGARKGEQELRTGAAASALDYRGTPYRWGGKTQEGIDCSGLAFMSWMENGILIYRDAQIMPEYPVREIPLESIRTGDLIFFPGHVALYLGDGKYIHATAWAGTPWVTVNSLNPEDPDYRADLAGMITACGTVF